MKTKQDLKEILERINGRGYPAYKDTKGEYDFGSYILRIDHVQSDPFASPSDVSIIVKDSGIPERFSQSPWSRVALQDMLLRIFYKALAKKDQIKKGSGKSGVVRISRPVQEVLERTAVRMDPQSGLLTIRLQIGFPANGRRICSEPLIRILFAQMPVLVQENLIWSGMSQSKRELLEQSFELSENQHAIRQEMARRNLVAFVADQSVLPRASGVDDQPMKEGLPFVSPKSLQVSFDVPYGKPVRGMGIPKGITLIVGGGYHGKSTLLEALESGVYNHTLHDGREYVLTSEDALKIRAEDGRSVHNEDISAFISTLPNGKDTACFVTEDASGSTSQAANVTEALESGSRLLLIDEDTSATNFMIRDELMASVIHPDKEPIIPFIERIGQLSREQDVSTILVAGSSGAYFHEADLVLQMDQYEPRDITDLAKKTAAQYGQPLTEERPAIKPRAVRIPKAKNLQGKDRLKVKVHNLDTVGVDRQDIDVRYMEQLKDKEQLEALGKMMAWALQNEIDGKTSLPEIVEALDARLEAQGLDSFGRSQMARPRRQELYGLFNRARFLDFEQKTD